MATAACSGAAVAVSRVIRSKSTSQPSSVSTAIRTELAFPRPKLIADPSSESGKIVLQPRVCTLRSYGSDRDGAIPTRRDADVSPFLASLSEYIENSRRSQDFETISGRLAMIAFAGAVTVESVTGNSIFRKMDVQGIAEAGGACLGAIICAAAFAWFSSNRARVGKIFTSGCNTFVDSLVDNLVDGLFYDTDLRDWSDEV